MPLPDIPVDAWIADQQQQFRKITDPLFPAFEFEQAAQEMPIPHDYPLAGGPDQWDQARQQEIERQLRDQQAQDEAAQRQREQEIEQQLRAEQQAQEQAATSMATDAGIPTPDTALATFQQAAEQGPSQDNTSTVAFGGPPPQSPEQQFLVQSGSMNQDFFDPDQGPHESIPPRPGTRTPIQNDDGSVTTERSITVTEPDINQGRATNIPTVWDGQVVDDNTAIDNVTRFPRQWQSYDSIPEAEQAAQQRSADLGAGREASIGGTSLPYDSRVADQGPHEAADNTSSALWPEAEATLPQSPGFQDRVNALPGKFASDVGAIVDRIRPKTSLGEGLSQIYNASPLGEGTPLPTTSVDDASRRFEESARAAVSEPIIGALRSGLEHVGLDPNAALQAAQDASQVLGPEGAMVGIVKGAGGEVPRDAIRAIKALHASGLEESAAQAMRELAQNSPLTLEEIQARVLGRAAPAAAEATRAAEDVLPNEVPNPSPLTDEERALNAAADEKARNQPAHSGYLEDPTFGEPEDIAAAPRAEPELPVSTQSVARERGYPQALPGMEDVAAEGHIPGQSRATEAGLSDEAQNIRASERAGFQATNPAAERISFPDTVAQSERVNTADARRRILDADPGQLAAEGHALNTESAGVTEAYVQAKKALGDFIRENKLDPDKPFDASKLPEHLQAEGMRRLFELNELQQQVSPSNTASNKFRTEVARAFTNFRQAILGSQAAQQVQRMRGFYQELNTGGSILNKAGKTGVLNPNDRQVLEGIRDRLKNPKERVTGPGEAAETELDSIAEAARKARGPRSPKGPGAPGATPAAAGDVEESFAEKLGRLKREQGKLEDAGASPAELAPIRAEIEDTLSQVDLDAKERARVWFEKRGLKPNLNDLPEAEREKIINEAAGRSTVQRIRSAAKAEISGTAAAKQQESYTRGFEQAIQKQLNNEKKLQESIDSAVQKRIDSTIAREEARIQAAEAKGIAKETRLGMLDEVKTMANDAKDIQQAIRARPSDMDLKTWMDLHLRKMAEHSTLGETVSNQLRASFEKQYGEDAKRFMGGVERRNTAAEQKSLRDTLRAQEQEKLSALADQMDFALKHQNAPGAMQRFQELAADMTAVSQRGLERSQDIQSRMWRANLTQKGRGIKGLDFGPYLDILSKIDVRNPVSVKTAMEALNNPTWRGAYHELTFLNMLGDPRTNVRNAGANVLSASLRLFAQNPLEAFYGGILGAKDTGGVGSAITGFGKGFKEERPNAWAHVRQGYNPRVLQDSIDSMNIARMGREQLTEKLRPYRLAPLAEAMHMTVSRPLEAVDALLGHAMYASTVEQEIARMSNRFMHEKIPEFAGMSQEQIAASIRRNPWKYPQIIDRAEYVKNYTLLKNKDTGEFEKGLRKFMTIKNTGPESTFEHRFVANLVDFFVPFFNVALNTTKQGLERTVGAPIYAVTGAGHALAGHPRQAAEHFAKATIGGSMMVLGGMLAGSDNLTLDGPSDPTLRKAWLLDHQPHSWRMPGTKNWITWDNTPVAVPFGVMAGAAESMKEAELAGGKKGLTDSAMQAKMLGGAAYGASQGILSHSLLENIQQNFEAVFGSQASPNLASTMVANALSRYTPMPITAGMVSFLARMTDGMDRDVGRVQDPSLGGIAQNVLDRTKARFPGLREQLPERKNMFGEPTFNAAGGTIPRALSPFQVSPGQAGGDPGLEEKAQKLEGVGVGMPNAPAALTIAGYSVPLEPEEQRQFQESWGRHYSTILDQFNQRYPNRQFPEDTYTKLRDMARNQAEQEVARQLGADELRKRAREQRAREVQPVR
jgi:hypothetical protein